MSAPIRVVVADDSAFMRRLLAQALSTHGFDVLAAVEDGDKALAACRELRPDVLSLDLAMPGMDGIAVLRELRGSGLPTSVVVVSAFSPAHGARAVDALAEGAVELVSKPAGGDALVEFVAELGEKVRLAAAAKSHAPIKVAPLASPTRTTGRAGKPCALMIACSTGGPQALAELIPRLPSPLGAGTVIVQHMPAGFTGSLAARLDASSQLAVREAQAGDRLAADTALLAPGGWHLRISTGRRARLGEEDPIGALRPRADLTIADVARAYGPDVLLVVLTGMGKDGLEGAREVHRHGGRILAEAESSCTVYGMPRAIVDAGLADGVHDLASLPEAIAKEMAA